MLHTVINFMWFYGIELIGGIVITVFAVKDLMNDYRHWKQKKREGLA